MAALLVLAALGGGCAAERGARAPARVGVAAVFPLRGELAPWGEAALAGVRLAVREARPRLLRRNVEVALEAVDEGPPAAAVARAHLLAARPETVAVIGHLDSATAVPASEIYHQGSLLLLSPASTSPELTGRGLGNVFQWLPDDLVQAERLAAFAVEGLRAGRAFVVHDRTAYGQGLADAFVDAFLARGGRLAGYRALRRGERPDRGLAVEAARGRADLVFFGGLHPEGCRVALALAGSSLRLPLLGGDGLDAGAFRLCALLAGQRAFAASFLPARSEAIGRFRARFLRAFGFPPEPVSVYAYDAARCLLGALEEAASLSGGRPNRVTLGRRLRERRCQGLASAAAFDARGRNRLAAERQVTVQVVNEGPRRASPLDPQSDSFTVSDAAS